VRARRSGVAVTLAAARDVAPDNSDVLRELGRALTRQGRFEEAVGAVVCRDLPFSRPTPRRSRRFSDLRGAEQSGEPARDDSAVGAPEKAVESLVRRGAREANGRRFLRR